jgi:hypothetical protein
VAYSGENIEIEVRPEPTPHEREAIVRALVAAGLLDGSSSSSRNAWWLDGLRDELESGSETLNGQ